MVRKDTLIKLKEKERQIRQALIIDAARQVFGEKTYDQVSMSEIADAAGIAKSSIYTYFKGQEELYARIAYQDACTFIAKLKKKLQPDDTHVVRTAIEYFLSYYITHEPQWRMITHFALHGGKNMESMDKLNTVGRRLMDAFEIIFKFSGCRHDTRLLSHTLFSCLSGVLIAFRHYPGRSEQDRIVHMKKIGTVIESMVIALIHS